MIRIMKIAIFSDIHSNLEALHACCRRAEALGVERYVCLGDLIGYGADPVETLDAVMQLPGLIAIRGNHEEMVLSTDLVGTTNAIVQASRWTRKQLSQDHLRFLSGLSYIHNEFDVTFAHASAALPQSWDYLYEPLQVEACIEASSNNVTFIGHVHIPNIFFEKFDKIFQVEPALEGIHVPLLNRVRYVVNVGAVGQPRDGFPAASFTILDLENRQLCFQRVPYDYHKAAGKIVKAGLDPHFAQRLMQGV